MNRRILLAIPLAALIAACSGVDTTTPTVKPPAPEFAISDGAHAAGNADFFFLPPVVLPTGPLTNWTRGGFNGSLSPSVEICPLNVTTVGAVTPTTPCKAMTGFPVVISGSNVKKHFPPTVDPSDALSGLPDDWSHYHAKWKVPNPCNIVYRVTVKVGGVVLGFADVQCVTSILGLLTIDYKKFGPALRGLDLQIPFRIEQFALCAVPGVGPCSSAQVDLAHATAPVTVQLGSEPGDPAGSAPSGVMLDPQPLPVMVVTVQDCPDLNSRATDLPTFGRCIRITTDPALPPAGLVIPASVFVCNLGMALPPGMTHAQSEFITMHRLDVVGATQTLVALPHIAGCPQFETMALPTVGGMLRDLVRGRVTSAGNQLLAMVGPSTLYARRLNQGGGGLTKGFSDFQFALPAYMTIEAGDGQFVQPGATLPTNPTVMVRDFSGAPVANARVTFAPANGSAIPLVVVTAADGLASTAWTIGAAPGSNSLVASGRGIGGRDNSGPRSGVDPFLPIQTPFDVGGPAGPLASEVTVLKGSRTFTATGVSGDPLPVNYGSGGWSYQIDGTVPGDWNSNLVSPFASTGAAGFGFFNPSDECSLIQNSTSTAWGTNTTLYIRRNIALTSPASVQISVAIDNDVQIYVDGVDQGPGLLAHENCPTQGSITRTVSLTAGTHVIAFRAVDRGGSTYFDASITVPSF